MATANRSPNFAFSMTADTRDFETWLVKQSVVMGVSMGEVLRDEAPLLAVALGKATPPLDGRDFFSQTWGAQKARGVNRTAMDISRVYVTVNFIYGQMAAQDADAAKAFGLAVKRRDRDEINRLLGVFGMDYYAGADVGEFNPDYHKQARMRHGRVGKNQRVRQIVTRAADLNKYRRGKMARVGRLKAGWVSATRGLTKQPRWPAWLRKVARGEGSLSDNTRRRENPYIRMSNLVRYAGRRNNSDRFVFYALAYRERTIERKVRGMARRKWRK